MATSGWFVVGTTGIPTGHPLTKPAGLTVQHFAGSDYAQAVTWAADGLAWGPYATKAAAQAELSKIRAGKVPNPVGLPTNPPGAKTNPISEAFGGLIPQLTNTRGLVVRVLKVGLGIALILIGVAQLTHATSGIEKVLPAAAKGAVLA